MFAKLDKCQDGTIRSDTSASSHAAHPIAQLFCARTLAYYLLDEVQVTICNGSTVIPMRVFAPTYTPWWASRRYWRQSPTMSPRRTTTTDRLSRFSTLLLTDRRQKTSDSNISGQFIQSLRRDLWHNVRIPFLGPSSFRHHFHGWQNSSSSVNRDGY
jgi:hypothetical protein